MGNVHGLLVVLFDSLRLTGTKFACSSGAKTIAVSRLEPSQGSDWYVSKLIKGHKSTVSEELEAIFFLDSSARELSTAMATYLCAGS